MNASSAPNPLHGKLLFPFIAPPNGGKGTQTRILSQRYKLPTFDMGATFRAILKEGADPELKAELESFMQQGKLLPDQTVAKVFQKNFEVLAQQHPQATGFIIDGFPRTLGQASALIDLCTAWGAKLGKALYLNVSLATVEKRATGRRVCAQDESHVYNVNEPQFAPKQQKLNADGTPARDALGQPIWLCDVDQAELVIRKDDHPDKVKTRLQEYSQQTDPIIDFFRQRGDLAEINGEQVASQVTTDIEAHLQPLLGLSTTSKP